MSQADLSIHNEGRQPTMRDVQRLLSELSGGRRDNPAVLVINSHRMMVAKNNGYPKHLYHSTLEPVVVLDEIQEQKIRELGYQDTYRHQEYPKTLFRRNLTDAYGPRLTLPDEDGAMVAGVLGNHPYVETTVARTAEHEQTLMRAPRPAKCGPWKRTLEELEPLPQEPDENPDVTIARLQGQLAEARRADSADGPDAPARKRR